MTMTTASWRVVVEIEPTGLLAYMDDNDAARHVRGEIIAFINSTQGLPLLVGSVKVEHDEEG